MGHGRQSAPEPRTSGHSALSARGLDEDAQTGGRQRNGIGLSCAENEKRQRPTPSITRPEKEKL
jgi:hypothetical protein